jgi:hypothetical protein
MAETILRGQALYALLHFGTTEAMRFKTGLIQRFRMRAKKFSYPSTTTG